MNNYLMIERKKHTQTKHILLQPQQIIDTNNKYIDLLTQQRIK